MYLFDSNILLPLLYKSHRYHIQAVRTFYSYAPKGWSTSSITENGFIRVGAQKKIFKEAKKPNELRMVLELWKKHHKHTFWADDLSVTDKYIIDLPEEGTITDLYLLAHAVKNKGKLVTFDKTIRADCVRGGKEALIIIE